MLRHAALTTVSLLAVLGVSACSAETPAPVPTSPTPPATTAPAVPKVENPKNLKGIADACQLLKPEQLAALGGGGEPEQSMSEYDESQCFWRNDNFATNVAINTTQGGLAKITEKGEISDNFAPTQVEGYQGARIDEQQGLCRIELAIADDQSVEVNYSIRGGDTPEMQDGCGYAEKITSEVLKNIPNA